MGFKQSMQNFFNGLGSIWDDYTGMSQVREQNAANMSLAKYQTKVQEEMYNKYSSPDALMRQFKEAGLNPNLVYGSASSGQGNVPSFQAPHVERQVSGSDKLNKVLSAFNQALGLTQGVYSAAAAREAANQSAIKTLDDLQSLRRHRLDNDLEVNVQGYEPSIGYKPIFGRRKGSVSMSLGDSELLPMYSQYYNSVRSKRLNDAAKTSLSNLYDFGAGFSLLGDHIYSGPELGVPFYQSRNKQNWLKYDLMNELGNTGQFGKLIISALQLLK